MSTTESRPVNAAAPATTYWELERLREQLTAAAEYFEAVGSGTLLGVLPGQLYEASETIAELQGELAHEIVK